MDATCFISREYVGPGALASRVADNSLKLLPRFGVTLACLAAWRVLAAIPFPVAGTVDVGLHYRVTSDRGPFALLLGAPLERDSLVAMGLSPFLDAFVLFWLWALITGNLRMPQTNPRRMWRYLMWLTAGLALVRAFGLINLLATGKPAIVSSTLGILSILGLTVGTMVLFGMGRVIDRYGQPAGYGVWFLLGMQTVLAGVHRVGGWISGETGDPTWPAVAVVYVLVWLVLLGSTFLVIEGVREIVVRYVDPNSPEVNDSILTFHLLGGGVIVPVVLSSLAVAAFPDAVFQGVFGFSSQQLITYWSSYSEIPVVVIAYSATFFALVVGACLFTSAVRMDANYMARAIRKNGGEIPGISPGRETAQFLQSVSWRLALYGGVWMAVVMVVVPLAARIAESPSRLYGPIGGGPFIIGATIMLTAVKKVRAQLAR